MTFPGFTEREVQQAIADYTRTHPLTGGTAMVSIPIDPRRAAEQARGPKTYSEAVRALRVAALTSSRAVERRNAKKILARIAAPSTTTKETKMAKQPQAYSSPMGDIPSKEKKSASDDGKGSSAPRPDQGALEER